MPGLVPLEDLPDMGRAVPVDDLPGDFSAPGTQPRKPSRWDVIRAQLPAILAGVPNAAPAMGMAESAASLGSGMIATPVAGLAGAAAAPFVGSDRAAEIVRGTQSALTYQPRSEVGQAVTQGLSYPFEKLAQGADAAGGFAARVTGSPAVGAAVNAGLQSAPAVLLRGRVGNGGRVANRPGPTPAAGETAPRVPAPPKAERAAGLERVSGRDKPPSIDELKAAKDAAYAKAKEAGVVVTRNALNRLKTDLVNDLKEEGFSRGLHPKTAAALQEILATKGQLSLSQIETLRRYGNAAKGAIERDDARLGARIVDKIDDFEQTLAEQDVVAGSADAGTAFKEARALNTRYSKASQIEDLFERAKIKAGANYTQSGLENALRQEFKSLALDKKKIRRFTPEEQEAIKRVAMGAPLENAVRQLGKLAPQGALGGWFGIGATLAAGPAGAAIPIAGGIGRYAATRMTIRNAEQASEVMRRGPQKPKAKKEALEPQESQ